jgi:hypothetical protein
MPEKTEKEEEDNLGKKKKKKCGEKETRQNTKKQK